MIYSRIHDTTQTRKSKGVKKARYVQGDGEARNRYVYCQYCGFICDTKRDKLLPYSGVSASLSEKELMTEDKEYIYIESPPIPITALDYSILSYSITHNCPFCGGQYTTI